MIIRDQWVVSCCLCCVRFIKQALVSLARHHNSKWLQVQGLYKVNNTALQELHCRVKRVMESFQEFHIRHVLR